MLHPITNAWPFHNYKSFIIYNKESILSKWSAKNTLVSAKKCGIHADLFPGVYRDDNFDLLQKYNLKWNPVAKTWWNKSYHLDSITACFLSHYLLWRRCVDSNKPIIILEHDVEFNTHIDITEEFYDFDGVINLGQPTSGYWWHEILKQDSEFKSGIKRDVSECCYPHSPYRYGTHQDVDYCNCEKYNLLGAHSYIITPNAAQKLIDKAETSGIDRPDIFIDVDTVDIVDMLPFLSTQKQNFSLIEKGWDNVWEKSQWSLPVYKQDAVYFDDKIILPFSPKWKEWLKTKPDDSVINKIYNAQQSPNQLSTTLEIVKPEWLFLLKGLHTTKTAMAETKDILRGEKDGIFRDYFEDGTLRCIGTYKNGEMQGEWIYFLQDGNIDAKYEMYNGKLIKMDRGL